MAKKTVAELWEEIFSDYNVVSKVNSCGFFKITADEIRPYKEPRLMTKFDYSKQLPKIFKENELGILPIKNGEYIMINYKYHTTRTTPDILYRQEVPHNCSSK